MSSALPLQSGNLVDIATIIRIVVSLVLLLGITSAVLWLYQRRFGKWPPGFSNRESGIDVVTKIRLTPRTQVFVIRIGPQQFLLTESAGGTTTTPVTRCLCNEKPATASEVHSA